MTKRIDGNVDDLISFAKAYAGLGFSMQEQLNQMITRDFEIMDDGEIDLNTNALVEIKRRLGGYSAELDDLIDDYI